MLLSQRILQNSKFDLKNVLTHQYNEQLSAHGMHQSKIHHKTDEVHHAKQEKQAMIALQEMAAKQEKISRLRFTKI